MFLVLVACVAWLAGLGGAYLGTRAANHRNNPPRQASTLGVVKVVPRTEPLPALDVFAAASAIGPSVVAVQASDSAGSLSGTGLVLTSDGEIITNSHVVGQREHITVRLPGETEPRGAVVLVNDASHDLALLRIDAVGLHPATFADPGDIRVGDDVVVVGYALNLDGDPSVTTGIVSALHRTSADTTRALKGLIQTDAPISSGNSGGPLVNSLGQVVGIATFVVVSDQSSEANSVGFAISNEELLPRIDELRAAAGGEVAPSAFLGVSVIHRVDGGSGALVTEVAPSSPAAEAGVKAGDSIVSIDGTTITGRGGLVATVRDHQAGDRITITLMRGGVRVDVHATLVKGPAG